MSINYRDITSKNLGAKTCWLSLWIYCIDTSNKFSVYKIYLICLKALLVKNNLFIRESRLCGRQKCVNNVMIV